MSCCKGFRDRRDPDEQSHQNVLLIMGRLKNIWLLRDPHQKPGRGNQASTRGAFLQQT